jgi:uncharacterized protein
MAIIMPIYPHRYLPKRILHLDIIRGVALLGILLMNIQSFSMPSSAYINPSSWGDFTGMNYWYWAFSHVFADGKFMSIFSMLFGAGICLFTESAEKKGVSSVRLHYRRNVWLLAFGLMHAYLIWYGDILYSYALCSFWLVLMRDISQKLLWVVALVLLIVSSLINASLAFAISDFPPDLYDELHQFWMPDVGQHQAEIDAYTGSFSQQIQQRSAEAFSLQTEVFFSYFIFRGSALMLIGMALFKSGFLSGKYQDVTYYRIAFVGILSGSMLSGLGVYYSTLSSFDFNYALFAGAEWNAWGSIASALGYVALIVLAIEKRWLKSLQNSLAALGQMALSHYIGQSLICTYIFYGWGLGLFAQVERGPQLLIVAAVWAFQLWLSPIWLRHYYYGPLEWLWRSLTYWKLQPFVKKS